MNTLRLLGADVRYNKVVNGSYMITLKSDIWKLEDTEFILPLDDLEWLGYPSIIGNKLGLPPHLDNGTKEDDMNILLPGFVIDMASNVAAHGYRTFSRYHVQEYEKCPFPVLIPEGYEV